MKYFQWCIDNRYLFDCGTRIFKHIFSVIASITEKMKRSYPNDVAKQREKKE